MSLSSGEQFDRYTIEGSLGHGGMGEVYIAFDSRLQRRVALKVLRQRALVAEGIGGDPSTRMLREGRAAPGHGTVRHTWPGQGGVAGTPGTRAPEWWGGQRWDGGPDQFSGGVVAYDLLSARGRWKIDPAPLGVGSPIATERPADLGEI